MENTLQIPQPVAIEDMFYDVELDASNECVICLEPKDKPEDVCRLICGHTYHIKCLTDSFTQLYISNLDITCPLCRFVIQDKTSTEYILKRLSIMQTLPPPRREVVTNSYNDDCFNKAVVYSIPIMFILTIILGALIWSYEHA